MLLFGGRLRTGCSFDKEIEMRAAGGVDFV